MDLSCELLDGLGVVVWELTARELNLVAISDCVERLSGYPVWRWLDPSASLLDFVHVDDRARVLSALSGAAERCAACPIDFRILTADASVRWVRSSYRLVTAGTRPRRIVGTMLDVTDWHEREQRRLAEAAPDDEEARVHRATFDEALIGVAHASLEGRYLRVNRYLCDLLGYTVDELKKTDFLTISHPDELAQDLEAKARLIEGAITRYTREKRHQRKDGSFVWTNLTVSMHRNAAGHPAYFIAIVEDLTERKRLEQQERQAHKMEAIGRLAGGIAHDFNNLLTAIVGYVDLALRQLGDGDDSIREDLEQVRAAGKSAAALTGQLMTFSRQQVVEPQIVDLNAVLERMQGLLRRLIGEDIQVRWTPARPLDCVAADLCQLEQVVLNLALNARDAMPRGGTLTIETANVELDADYAAGHPDATAGRHVMLAISDTGVGMDESVRDHLFEPFYTTKAVGEGTGLGLATVYGIVRQSGGSIAVYSEPAVGTTFKVFLPRVDRACEVIEAEAPQAAAVQGTQTILLVEDQPEVRSVARRLLTRHGYTVIDAGNGLEALSAAADRPGPIQLLLTDVVMPGMSGPELADACMRRYPDIRVLFMSGYTRDTAEHRGLLETGATFIQKPFTGDALLRTVRTVLGDSG